MRKSTSELRRSTAFRVLILLGVLALVISALLIWRAVYSPPEVTDSEARAFIAAVDAKASADPGAVCDVAIFPWKCQDELVAANGVSLEKPSNIICTWPLDGSGGSRVVEVENTDPEGTRYRTSISVARDGKELGAWPMPYWLYPTRPIPNLAQTPVEDLPSEVDLAASFDPCGSTRSTK